MIKKIRHLKGMTQKEIYLNLCSRRQYSRIENNKSFPSIF
ncbi:TPA: helix-turn-helix transcriptional regulator, partial [Streptococcus suis]|nr:helix-turn-helix transcriptional regulator [Streptococcus suis]